MKLTLSQPMSSAFSHSTPHPTGSKGRSEWAAVWS